MRCGPLPLFRQLGQMGILPWLSGLGGSPPTSRGFLYQNGQGKGSGLNRPSPDPPPPCPAPGRDTAHLPGAQIRGQTRAILLFAVRPRGVGVVAPPSRRFPRGLLSVWDGSAIWLRPAPVPGPGRCFTRSSARLPGPNFLSLRWAPEPNSLGDVRHSLLVVHTSD